MEIIYIRTVNGREINGKWTVNSRYVRMNILPDKVCIKKMDLPKNNRSASPAVWSPIEEVGVTSGGDQQVVVRTVLPTLGATALSKIFRAELSASCVYSVLDKTL